MNKFLLYTLAILEALLIVILSVLLCKGCSTTTKQEPTRTITKYVPVPGDTIHDSIPQHVDTAYIIKNYYNKITYHDTIRVKDIAEVTVMDTVFQNSLAGRTVEINYLQPKIKEKYSHIGISIISGKQQMAVVGEYHYKNIKVFGGYDLLSKSPVIGAGINIINW